jgi:hypothetical protein
MPNKLPIFGPNAGKGFAVILRKSKLLIHHQRQDKSGIWYACGPVEKIDRNDNLLAPITRALECQKVMMPESAKELVSMLGIKSLKDTYANDRHLSGVLRNHRLDLDVWVSDGETRGLVPGDFRASLPLPLSDVALRDVFVQAFMSIRNA